MYPSYYPVIMSSSQEVPYQSEVNLIFRIVAFKIFELSKLFIDRTSNSIADKTVLIFFLGGCTYTEIAVLKKLAKQKGKFKYFTKILFNLSNLIPFFFK